MRAINGRQEERRISERRLRRQVEGVARQGPPCAQEDAMFQEFFIQGRAITFAAAPKSDFLRPKATPVFEICRDMVIRDDAAE
ncbi:MAG: hypothetical protein BGO51_14890 [Rhodospirillales bacterium 69-11]|nr:MAG: hypothetical protein BGO51_14890 [Rhodospirillales bacterium 69-11]